MRTRLRRIAHLIRRDEGYSTEAMLVTGILVASALVLLAVVGPSVEELADDIASMLDSAP